MRTHRLILPIAALLLPLAPGGTAEAQEPATAIACKERPCAVLVDWTREGGIGNLTPDRRYGNPVQLEEWIKAHLTQRGYANHSSTDSNALQILMQPQIRNAMCDQMAGTSTDRSCRAVSEIQVRLGGPDAVMEGIDLPSRLRNRCGSEDVMPTDKLAVYVAEYIIYAVEGKAKGERRPVGRC